MDGAVGIRFLVVENWEQFAMLHREKARDDLNHSASGSKIAEVALRGGNGNWRLAIGKSSLDRGSLGSIALFRRQAVCVNVADLIDAQSGCAECLLHDVLKSDVRLRFTKPIRDRR